MDINILYQIGEAFLLVVEGVKDVMYLSEGIYPLKLIVVFEDGRQLIISIKERTALTFTEQ